MGSATNSSTKKLRAQIARKLEKHLLQKYGTTEALDYIDIDSLIDKTLTVEENVKIIEQQIDIKMSEFIKQQIADYEKLCNSVLVNIETSEIVYLNENGRISQLYINGIWQPISYVQTKLYIPRVSSRKLKNMVFSRFRKMLLPQLNELYNSP